MQLAYKVVTEHPVIATQVVPLVVQSGDTNWQRVCEAAATSVHFV